MRRIIMAPIVAIVAVIALVGGGGAATALTLSSGNSDVCSGLDSGKIDVKEGTQSVTVSAPEGKLIDGYCVKAGSTNGGTGGPVYVDVDPPVKSLVITYPSGKDISHYSVSYIDRVKPDKPADKVVYGDWTDGDKSCESKTVTQTRTKSVTTYTWDATKWEWVASDPVITTETRTRPMTADEIKVCAGEQPEDKVVKTEWIDGDQDCESKTVTQTRTVTTTPYVYNASTGMWVEGTPVTTTETRDRPMTADEIEACDTDTPTGPTPAWDTGDCTDDNKRPVTLTVTVPKTDEGSTLVRLKKDNGVVDSKQLATFEGEKVATFNLGNLPAGTYTNYSADYSNIYLEGFAPIELGDLVVEKCEDNPPPPPVCPPFTGSVKTTDKDGNVVNENTHYKDKSDVYVYGSQLPDDLTKVYIRVVAPGGTVLSSVKEEPVTDGTFGPTQLPTFLDTPNPGGEYKVEVSTTPDFEHKCTKSDNFKIKKKDVPPPVDVCPNLPGNQPEGTDCTPDTPPVDVCPDLPGNQPVGTDCTPNNPPVDKCPNKPGMQGPNDSCTVPPVNNPPTDVAPPPSTDKSDGPVAQLNPFAASLALIALIGVAASVAASRRRDEEQMLTIGRHRS